MSSTPNLVEIDVAALQREADAVELGAAPPSPDASQAGPAPEAAASEPTPQEIQSKAAAIEPVIAGVLSAMHGMVAPAWTVEHEKMKALAQSSSLALVYWFPHELPPKYVALLMVGASLYGIAQDNRDPKTGAYRPMREAPKPAPDVVATAS